MSAQGNMSGAYFVGKAKLLEWLNEFLQEKTAKVEDCSSGHQYLMCLDAIYPGQVNFLKAKYDAQLEWEKIENLKIVQQVLTVNKVDRVVDVGKLAKGKLQDNLEFLQWFKHWFDQNCGDIHNFDPIATRAKFGKKNSAADQQVQQRQQQMQQQMQQQLQYLHQSRAPAAHRALSNDGGQFLQPKQQQQKQSHGIPRSGSGPGRNVMADANNYKVQQLELENTNLNEKIDSMTQQITKYEKTINKKNSEAQFYFNKLRQIEVYIQQMLQKYKETGYDVESEGNVYEATKICNHINGLLIAPYEQQ